MTNLNFTHMDKENENIYKTKFKNEEDKVEKAREFL